MTHSANGKDGAPCALCGRELKLTWHHLIPKKLHKRPAFRRKFALDYMRSERIAICRPCHDAVHRFHTELELGQTLNTLERLRADPAVARHVDWARKQRVARTGQQPVGGPGLPVGSR